MANNREKRYMPSTDPKWGRELPEGYDNSLVDKNGNNWDNGYNFDEKDDDETEETTYDDLANEVKFDPQTAEKAKQESLEDQEK